MWEIEREGRGVLVGKGVAPRAWVEFKEKAAVRDKDLRAMRWLQEQSARRKALVSDARSGIVEGFVDSNDVAGKETARGWVREGRLIQMPDRTWQSRLAPTSRLPAEV